jgi:hypothetical protein
LVLIVTGRRRNYGTGADDLPWRVFVAEEEMKITAIREVTKPIRSDIRNAYIDFSKMTLK